MSHMNTSTLNKYYQKEDLLNFLAFSSFKIFNSHTFKLSQKAQICKSRILVYIRFRHYLSLKTQFLGLF